MPLVSICIPTYRQPECLKRLLDSVFEQTYIDYEVIITDDTPDDSIKKVVDLFLDSRIRYYKNKITLGLPENWNEAIRHAEGEYIKIMHHDDCFFNNQSLQKYIELTLNGTFDFVFSGAIAMFEDGHNYKHFISKIQFKSLIQDPAVLLMGNLIGGPSSIMYKKDINFLFDKELIWLVDIEFYYRILISSINCNFTSYPLVISFAEKDRISNFCCLNSKIEIPENLYFINKHKINSLRIISFLVNRFKLMNVVSLKDIRNCGFDNKINFYFSSMLLIKNSFLYKFYKKVIKKLNLFSFKIKSKNQSKIDQYLKTSYSQSGEDLIIDYILQSRNHHSFNYIDIGAHHPFKLNNTCIFYKRNNYGINIEPNPELYNLFVKERVSDVNLNIGIAESNNKLEYYFFETSTLNTFSIEDKNQIISQGHQLLKSEIIQVRNINEIINEYLGKSPDILFIDVEGFDFEIILSYDFEKYAPLIICIETISYDLTGRGVKNNHLIDYILNKGYILYADTNINSIFVLKSFWEI